MIFNVSKGLASSLEQGKGAANHFVCLSSASHSQSVTELFRGVILGNGIGRFGAMTAVWGRS